MILLDMPYQHHPRTGFAHFDEVREINPVARVPALLLEDGEALYDSTAILDHLDSIVEPQRRLVPGGGPERRMVLRTVALALGVTEKAVAIVYEQTQRPPDKLHRPWLERCGQQVESGLAALDREADGPPLSGGPLNQAQITAGVMYDFVRLTSPSLLPPGRYPRLDAHFAGCEKLDAFKQTQPEP
jgi:glutathione S-transferase